MRSVEYAGDDGRLVAFHRMAGASLDRTIVYLQTGTIPFDAIAEDAAGARILGSLATLGTVVVFDRRGIGMSDPLRRDESVQEAWAADLLGVMEAASDRPVVVFAQQFMDFVLDALAARPDLVESIVWYEPTTDWLHPDSPDEIRALVQASVRGDTDFLSVACPTRSADRGFRTWFDGAGARGASPTIASQIYERATGARADRLRTLAGTVAVPMLVVRRPASLSGTRTKMPDDSLFSNATVVQVPGRDWHLHGEDLEAVMNAAAGFVLGAADTVLFRPERALAAIVFTDIVESTRTAASIGDSRWKQLIAHHDALVASEATNAAGRMVKSTGDGALMIFPSARGGLSAAVRLRTLLADDGIQIRAGVHVGDVDRRNDDVSGLAVTAAARIVDRARPGQILVSSSVVTSLLGSEFRFRAVDTVELRGMPGSWELHEHLGALESDS